MRVTRLVYAKRKRERTRKREKKKQQQNDRNIIIAIKTEFVNDQQTQFAKTIKIVIAIYIRVDRRFVNFKAKRKTKKKMHIQIVYDRHFTTRHEEKRSQSRFIRVVRNNNEIKLISTFYVVPYCREKFEYLSGAIRCFSLIQV